jgi:hypothetical protein
LQRGALSLAEASTAGQSAGKHIGTQDVHGGGYKVQIFYPEQSYLSGPFCLSKSFKISGVHASDTRANAFSSKNNHPPVLV